MQMIVGSGVFIYLTLAFSAATTAIAASSPPIFAFRSDTNSNNDNVERVETVWLSAARTATSNGASIAVADFDWIRPVADGILVGVRGSLADCEEVFNLLQAHCIHEELEAGCTSDRSSSSSSGYRGAATTATTATTAGTGIDVVQVANLCRCIITERLFQYRQGKAPTPMNAEVIVAGSTRRGGLCSVRLFWLDSIGSLKEIRSSRGCCAHADASVAPLLLSLLNELLLTPQEPQQHRNFGAVIASRCWAQLRQRSAAYTPPQVQASTATATGRTAIESSKRLVCWKIDSTGKIAKMLLP